MSERERERGRESERCEGRGEERRGEETGKERQTDICKTTNTDRDRERGKR